MLTAMLNNLNFWEYHYAQIYRNIVMYLRLRDLKINILVELLLMSAGRMATFGRYQDVMSNCLRLQRMMRV